MEIAVEKHGSLGRSLKIRIPDQRVRSEIDSRLNKLSRTARLPGFRKGRIPHRVIRMHYAESVQREVLEVLLSRTLDEALTQQELRPVANPEIEDVHYREGAGLDYTVHLELFPAIELQPMRSLRVRRIHCEITEQELERTMQTLRQRHRRMITIDRAARAGDVLQLRIQYSSERDRAPAQPILFELGARQSLPALEQALQGARADLSLELALPLLDAAARPRQGALLQPAQVKVEAVCRVEYPALDDPELLRTLGVADLPALQREVRAALEQEAARRAWKRTRQEVFQALYDAHEVELPEKLLARELQELQQAAGEQAQGAEIELQVRRSLGLRLLVSEIVRREGLKPDPSRVRRLLREAAAHYVDAQAMIDWCYQDQRQLKRFEALALEEKFVEQVLDQAQVTEQQISFASLDPEAGSADPGSHL